jgi:hypothetical protein
MMFMRQNNQPKSPFCKNEPYRSQTCTTHTTTQEAQKNGLAGNRTLDHSQADPLEEELMLREYYTTKPQARKPQVEL